MNQADSVTEQKNKVQLELVTRQLIMPIVTGAAVNFILDKISELGKEINTLIIVLFVVILGIIYARFYFIRKRPKKVIISYKTVNIITIALIISIFLICIAAFILYQSLITVIFQIGWLIVMIILIRIARSIPVAHIVPKSVLTSITAVGLGAALSVGAIPIASIVTNPTIDLTIYNNCNIALWDEDLNIFISPNSRKKITIPAITVDLTRTHDQIILDTAVGIDVTLDLPEVFENVIISFDNILIASGETYKIILFEKDSHTLKITCN